MTTRRALALAALIPVTTLVATATTALPASASPVADPVVSGGGGSFTVPPVGVTVVGEGVSRNGEVRGFRITNTGTEIRVVREGRGAGGGWFLAPLGSTTSTSRPTTSTAPMMTALPTTTTSTASTDRATAGRAGDPPACKDRTFNLEHHKWHKALRYHINLAKMPKRFGKKKVVDQVKHANANMRKGRNSCGKPRITAPASHYLGRTSKKPNIDPQAGPAHRCGRGNEMNVVGFGNLPGGLLGWTCYWYSTATGRMLGADMMLDNGPDLATKLPSPCANQWDFEGTVTHEWGHAYGMAHTGDGHSNLTMQHLLSPCSTYARTLGIGDWLGMKKMYGAR